MPLTVQEENRDSIVVWMNQPSHYQTVFFREISARRSLRFTVFYATDLAENRKMLGWSELEDEEYAQTVFQGRLRAGRAVYEAWRNRRAVHLVNGIWSVPIFVLSSTLLLILGARVFYHSERPNPEFTRKGIWQMVKRIWIRVIFLRAQGIFVIGNRAGKYFRDLGVPSGKIIPFMYFNRSAGASAGSREPGRPFTIIYAGQFVARKRVEDLIDAFTGFRAQNANSRLLLVGSGPLRSAYAAKAAEFNLADAIEIIGPLAPDEVVRVVQRSDVLVLPSAFDGWGLTVNESLQAGVPVICSDGCGAAELLEERPDWGIVVPVGDTVRLENALRDIAAMPDRFRPKPNEVEERIGPRAVTSQFLHRTLAKCIGTP